MLKFICKFFFVVLIFFGRSNQLGAQTGTALHFDGFDDYIQAPARTFGNNWTIETWVYPTNVNGGWYTILGQDYWDANQGFALAIYNGTVFVNTPLPYDALIEAPITVNTWCHLAVTYNNGIFALYKNGSLMGLDTAGFLNANQTFVIGGRHNNTTPAALLNSFHGSVDEVRVWNYTRTQCEINQYMNCEIPTTATGLTANFHFNQGTGGGSNGAVSTATDASGNGNGTLQGFNLTGGFSNWLTYSGSPFLSGTTLPALPSLSEINVQGNGNNIPDGSTASSLSNHTDFGTSYTRTFVVQNILGLGVLNTNKPVFTGSGAAHFSITVPPATNVPAVTGTTSFVVQFIPKSVGAKSATLNLYSLDCDEPVYNFVVTATAVPGAALNFDGVNDYVETNANLAELGQADFTIEAWIKTTAVSQGIVVCSNSNTTWEIGEKALYLDGGGVPNFVGWGNNYIQGNLAVNDGVWHHIAVVWDYSGSGTSGVGKLYIDGVDHTGTVSYVANNNNTGTFKIGRANFQTGEGLNYFNGEIDEVRIYDRVLCLPEILNNKNCELPSPTTYPDLNGYYRFNHGAAFGDNTALTSYTSVTVFANVATLTNFSNIGATSNWISQGGVTTGSSCAAYLDREINIRGNSTNILNGDITPSTTDHTDFGNVGWGTVLSRTFVIQNTGALALSITAYSLSGANATDFTITTNPAATIGAGSTGTIVVSFSAATLGLKTASLTIASNDCDEAVSRFVINATGIPSGEALAFDGINDYVQLNDPVFGTSDLTLEAWIKPTAVTGGGVIFSTRTYECCAPGNWFTVGTGTTGLLSLELAEAGGGPTNYTAITTATNMITLGAWNHVAFVRSGLELNLYVNGVLGARLTDNFVRNFQNTGAGVLNLGVLYYAGGVGYFKGAMDEVRLWNVAKTQNEIQTSMNCEIPGAATNLIGNYHFSQGAAGLLNTSINTLGDASASTRTGLLSGFSLNGTTSNWISGGGVSTGSTTTNPPIAEIEVRGNGNLIADGTTTTSISDFTDFNGTYTRTFVVQNIIGGGSLNFAPYMTGTNATQFSVTTFPAALINGISSQSFAVTFMPSSTGVKTATLNLHTNDQNESIYDFVITATAVPAAALDFDGSDDVVSVDNTPALDNLMTGNFSFEAWIKPTVSGLRTILSKGNGSGILGTGEYIFQLNASNQLSFFHTATNNWKYSTGAVTLGVWSHVAVTYDGTNIKFYINGVLDSYAPSNTYTFTTGANPFYIGRQGFSCLCNKFAGSIDEVRIWNVSRTQCELQAFMDCEIPTTSTGLIANYHFNQGVSQGTNSPTITLTDATGVNTGTLSGFTLSGSASNWVLPGGVTSGNTTSLAPSASIALTGSSNPIANNATTVTLINGTDFGSSTTRTFVITNNNTGTLNIGVPFFTGPNASNFSITILPALSLTASATTSFVVAFTPTSTGVKNATVNIYNNDCSVPIHNFAIQGTPPVAAALDFDGVDDYVTIAHTSSLNAFPLTVETWVKTSYTASIPTALVGKYVTTSFNGWLIYLAGGTLNADYFNNVNNSVNYPITATTSITDNNWHHVALVVDATGGRLYVDGILSSPNEPWIGTPSPPSTTQDVLLGSYDTFFPGSLDEVRIWNTARSQCEIQSYMNCEIPTTATGLIANYHFNQGSAGLSNSTQTVLIDAAGSNSGTLSAFTLTGTSSNWVSPGGVISGSTTPAVPAASIIVSGNSNAITPGATSTSTLNFTNFGSVNTRTFVITNNNSGTLNIGVPIFTGANASDFSVTVLPTLSLTASATTSFVVAFTPTSTGVKNATVNLYNNDCNLPIFTFAIEGTPQPASALNFDGVDDLITIPSAINLNNQSFTIEFWAARTGTAYNMVVGQGPVTFNNGVLHCGFRTAPGNEFTFAFYNNDLDYSGPATSDLQYHHWACVYNNALSGANRFIYLDGVLVASDYSNSDYLGSGLMHIGDASYFANAFQGSLDELRIWGVARSQCDIQSYMNCEIPTTAPGLIANYHFNQGSAGLDNSTVTTLIDVAGSAHTGTLTDFSLNGATSNWDNQAGVTSGSTTPAPPTASILVSGNSTTITPGATSTSTLNFTDFGSQTTRTFVIQNSAAGTLNISVPYFSGINASEFSVTVLPSLSLAASATTSFEVAFTPTAGGFRTATLNINCNDCTVPVFFCTVGGTPAVASALNFDGIDDYVAIPSVASMNFGSSSDITVEARVQLAGSHPGFHGVVVKAEPVGAWKGYQLAIVSNSIGVEFVTTTGAVATPQGLIGTTALNDGLWHHLAMVVSRSNNNIKLYVDGLLQANVTNSAVSGNVNVINPTFIGSERVNVGFINGKIDEVRIWNSARTQCELQTYMACELSTSTLNLVAYYQFNQGAAVLSNPTETVLSDAAGSNNGLLDSFTLNGATSNFVNPGGVVTGSITPAPPTSSLIISGNSNSISPGAVSTSTLDFTDFGTSVTRTFVVQNPGTGSLYLNGGIITGANASDFSITTIPTTTLGSSVSSSFVITFSPSALGTRSAIVNVISSDCAAAEYSFVITGTAVPGSALNFDGTDDGASRPLLTSANNSITLQAKVFMTANQLTNKIIAYNGTSSSNGYGLYLFANSPEVYVLYGGVAFIPTSYSLNLNQWNSLSMVIENSSLKFYANGILAYTNLTVSPIVPTGSFMVGVNQTGTENFNGSIDEVLFWNRTLSQCEIQAYLNCEVPTAGTSLLANYHFNQGIGEGVNTSVTTVTDASGNNNSLTLANMDLTGNISNWIKTGAVISGSSCGVYTEPEINLVGNGISISAGNTTPTLTNHSDFGATCVNSPVVRTFTVQNTGNLALTVSSMSITGTNANQFSLGILSPAPIITPSNLSVYSVTFIPTIAGILSATVTILNDDCDEALFDFAITGTANPLPVVTANASNSIICNSFTTSVFGGGADTYTWSGSVMDNVAFTPTVSQTYTVNGTNTLTGCTSTNSAVQGITVNPTPTITASAGNSVVCFGGSSTLSAAGALSYTWEPGTLTGSATIQTPVSTSVYSVTGTNSAGCAANNTVNLTVTVNPLPTVSVSTTNSVICSNFTTSVNGSGADTYTWTGGITNGIAFTPSVTQTYSVTGTNTLTGCTSTNSAIQSITVNPTPTITASASNSVLCFGGSSTLTAAGALSYTWQPGTIINTVTIETPTSTSVYSVSGTSSAGCVANNTVNLTVTVNPLPVVTATTTNSIICNGFTTSVSGGGADTYTWTGSVSNNIAFTPSTTLSYTVNGTNTLTGCTSTNSAVQGITVNPTPTITASTNNSVFCFGGSSTFSAAGASSYTWQPGTIIASLTVQTPTATTVYSVTGTSSAGCAANNTVNITVTVNPLPVVSASTTNSVICNNFSTSVSGGGADTYTWSGSITNGIAFTPSVTLSYTVNGTNTLTGCTSTNSAVQSITVNPTPTITASANNSVICFGGNSTLTAGGASNYTWQPGTIINSVTVQSPTTTSIYSVTGTSSAGCVANNTVNTTVTVNPLPVVSASTTASVICNGFTTSVYGGNADTYTWTGNVTNTVAFTPSVTLSYTVNGTNTLTGCTSTNSAVQTITVNPTPTITASASNSVLCFGGSSTLTAGGASSYTWQPGNIINSVTIQTPVTTTIYSVSGTSSAGCVSNNTVNITITVNPLPIVTASTTGSVVCDGFTTSVFGGGADTYTWTGNVTDNVAFTPSTTLSYTVNGTNTLTGCTSTNSAVQSITVNPTPTITASANNSVICFGESSTLTAAGAFSYTWQPGTITNSSTIETPGITTIYSVSGTSSAGCIANNTVNLTVTVNLLPVVTASTTNSVICDGFTTSVFGGGADTYTWTGGVTNGTTFTPTATQSYSVNGTNTLTGCTSTNTAVQTITVNTLPTVSIAVTNSIICDGFSASLTASGADTYTWVPGTLNGATVTPSPSLTTQYTLTGTSLEGCTSTNVAVQSISVNAIPIVSVSISNSIICMGGSITINGSGADTYTVSNGIQNNVAFSPTASATYTLNGTNIAGCTNTNLATVSITVNPLPVLNILTTDSVLCFGDSTSLVASGAQTYTWSGGVVNGKQFAPASTDSYTVTASDQNSCVNKVVTTITVNALPSLTIASTQSISCIGQSQTLTASGANTYTWNTSAVSPSILIVPFIISSFTVTATDTNNCVNTASFMQEVMKCEAIVYTGITANGDGVNDIMTIQNIESYPNNNVSVYNRWGMEVFTIKGYNNKDKAWPLPGETSTLTPATYFYIIDFGDGSKSIQGWVELIEN